MHGMRYSLMWRAGRAAMSDGARDSSWCGGMIWARVGGAGEGGARVRQKGAHQRAIPAHEMA